MGTSWPEHEPNPFPTFDLLPRLSAAGAFLGRCLRLLPSDPPLCQSDHFRPPEASELAQTGAEFTLAQAMDADLSGFGYQDPADPYVSPGSYYFRSDLEA